MNFRHTKLLLTIATVMALTACGSPGVPLPPSLELARPVANLRATRKGDQVTLTWSPPAQTTDQHNIRRGGVIIICRSLSALRDCGVPVGRVPFQKPSVGKPQTLETYTDRLPSSLNAKDWLSAFIYAVSIQNSYGRSAGLSNQVQVPAAPTLSPPADLHAQLSASGVTLTWSPVANPPVVTGLRFLYRIYRRDVGTKIDVVAGELPVAEQVSPHLLDQSFEWEKSYEYRVIVVTVVRQPDGSEQQVEGDDTPPVAVVAHDVFPPATPVGLQAALSGPGQKQFVDLIWTPDTAADLAGYNVYRHEDQQSAEKITTQLLKTSAFRDADIVPGHTYFYSVSAMDVRGNESSRSEEISQEVPAQ